MPSTFAEYSLKQRLGEVSSSAAVYAAEYDGQEVILLIFNACGVPCPLAPVSDIVYLKFAN